MRSILRHSGSMPKALGPIPALLLALALVACGSLEAQNTIHLSDEAVIAGDSLTVAATFDTAQEIYGFTFGVRHVASLLTPLAANPGADLQLVNSGAGPDYFFADLAAANGPGLFVASVFQFAAFNSPLPIGTGLEAVLLDYASDPAASPATTTPLNLAADLGSPAVAIAFSTGVTIVPDVDNGSVTFLVPPPTGVTCTLLDNCTCDFAIAWTNPTIYTAIELRIDGVLSQTLSGAATSASVSLPTPGSLSLIEVRGIVGTEASTDSGCTADCPAIVPAGLPTALDCVVAVSDPVLGCTIDLSWTPSGTYSVLQVSLDGAVVQTLIGTDTATSLSVPAAIDPQQICITATDECGDPIPGEVCCEIVCSPGTEFRRTDCNGDSGTDISDPVYLLSVLFSGGATPLCLDACDGNDDGGMDISDAVFMLAVLFTGGSPPPAPYPGCGLDGTDTDALDCGSYPGC